MENDLFYEKKMWIRVKNDYIPNVSGMINNLCKIRSRTKLLVKLINKLTAIAVVIFLCNIYLFPPNYYLHYLFIVSRKI